MKAGFFKRSTAYIIDIIIISLISSLVLLVFPYSTKVEKYQEDLKDISMELVESKISIEDYSTKTVEVAYKIESNTILYTVANVVIVILYFGVFQFKNKGMTLGKKVMRIRVEKEGGKLSLNDLILRSLFTTSLTSNLISLATIMLVSKKNYLFLDELINLLNGVIIIIIVFMILYRKDKKGLHDILLNTDVIEIK